MTSVKTVRRDVLLRRLKEGRLVAKCCYHYTDDYALDNELNFGKTRWLPAYVETWVDEGGDRGHWSRAEGIGFNEADFRYKSGSAWKGEGSDVISFQIHSNYSFDVMIVPKGVATSDFLLSLEKKSEVAT